MTALRFIHGWAQSSNVWHFQQQFGDAVCISLPGHDGAALSDDWIATLQQQLPETPCILVGWSLGGMLAMQLLVQHPGLQQRIRGLVLVGSTPRFVSVPDWPHGTSPEIFQSFVNALQGESSATATLSRFFTLMLQHTGMQRSDIRHYSRIATNKTTPPQTEMLKLGLHYLASMDLRSVLDSIQLPCLIIHGSDDAIVPVSAAEYLAQHLKQSTIKTIEHAGHAPFLTHADVFNQTLETWCQSL